MLIRKQLIGVAEVLDARYEFLADEPSPEPDEGIRVQLSLTACGFKLG
ncbi:MAG TPA: hypothetical protein VGJ48_13960 [Pyrinomonadaceae bacterium]